MVSRENTQLPLFYSRLQDKAALGHNALTQDWSRWRAIYLFPPLWLIPRTIQKLKSLQRAGHHDCTMDSGRDLAPRYSRQSDQVEVALQLRDSKYWTAGRRRLDRLQFLKQALSHVHGETIADSLVLAYKGSTNRQAQSVWRKFQTWLPAEIESVTRNKVLHFLIYLESELKLGARTIVNYRGCLALPLRTAFHIDFNHESFCLLTRSLFLKNPPIRKKIPSWTLDVALETFSSQWFGLPHAEKTYLFLKTLFLFCPGLWEQSIRTSSNSAGGSWHQRRQTCASG